MKRPLIALCLILIATAGLAGAATYTVDKTHSGVDFKVRHLVSKTPGKFTDFEGTIVADLANLDASSVTFTIKAASIDTGNADRDKHLRSADFFDVETYPEITFTSSKITKAGDNSYAVTGTLTMHGVSKTVTLPVTYLGEVKDPWGNTKAGFEIETTLDRKDYGIVWNKALDAGGVLLGDEVEITINLETQKK
ncbi:MAG: YceI family protein [Thermoanaerobaculales bacterium]|jgi:polyisoprenoid-binding protein YceI|nr:YceI family protein [Thermoanaerobaculales bacterium]